MKLTMIDGKASNAICDNKSAQVCTICKCTPKEVNRLTENSKIFKKNSEANCQS